MRRQTIISASRRNAVRCRGIFERVFLHVTDGIDPTPDGSHTD